MDEAHWIGKRVCLAPEIAIAPVNGPALALTVPLVVDAGVADNWAEAH